MDTSGEDGLIGLNEFVAGFFKYYIQHKNSGKTTEALQRDRETIDEDPEDAAGGEETEDEDEEETPEWLDTESLSEEEQHAALIKSSCIQMAMGTFIVLLFSDPMVDVLSELGARSGIPAFFVAFILAPLASNASELIASISYASKKKVECSDVSFGQLLGAAIMNNTFCLGIFLALICFRPLVWTFTAETLSILIIELIMAYYACKTTHTVSDAVLVGSLFPISIVLVYVLEYQIGLN